ncbi:hypothetical protein D3C80_1846470 [compost metagenome]
MLDGGYGTDQFTAHYANFWALGMVEQFVQPVFADNRCVVVEQHQILATRMTGCHVVDGAEVEGGGVTQYAQFVATDHCHFVQPLEGFR